MNIVLVHGAWADGSSWDDIIARLLDSGHRVVAAQLPLTSLDDDVAATRRASEQLEGPTVYVGHSYGGAVITNAARGELDVLALVHISAFIPDRNETLGSIIASYRIAPDVFHSLEVDSGGFAWLPLTSYMRDFAPDIRPERAQSMAAAQKPLAIAILEQRSGVPAWHEVPSWALISANDRVIHPDAQRRIAQRAGARVTSVAGGHASLVSRPRETVEVILAATEAVVPA